MNLQSPGMHLIIYSSVCVFKMHIGGLLEVILQGFGSAPLCTKEEVSVLLGCCPPPLHVSWVLLHALDTELRGTANLLPQLALNRQPG